MALAGEEEQDHKMASFLDEVNAYSYLYPLELPSKKFVFKWYVYSIYACLPFYFIFVFFNLKIQLIRRPVDSVSKDKDSRLDGGYSDH